MAQMLGGITNLKGALVKRKQELEKANLYIDKTRKIEPEGKLRVSMSKGCPHYYRILESADTVGNTYARKIAI